MAERPEASPAVHTPERDDAKPGKSPFKPTTPPRLAKVLASALWTDVIEHLVMISEIRTVRDLDNDGT